MHPQIMLQKMSDVITATVIDSARVAHRGKSKSFRRGSPGMYSLVVMYIETSAQIAANIIGGVIQAIGRGGLSRKHPSHEN
jgi:hypothetical protein